MYLTVDSDLKFLAQIPEDSGVYRYYDSENNLLYVGKAINLRKRVKSYFQRRMDLSPRISIMVSKIVALEVTITENEVSALLLESNLIKTLHPKYNIIFRDDKSYPYIRITAHDYPLVEYFRGKNSSDGTLFGPYPNSYAVKETLDLLQRLFKLRTCQDSEFANRSRPCMLHQIGRCCAPCVNKVDEQEYGSYVDYARRFLSGNYSDLITRMTETMYQYAEHCEFEQAGMLRDKIALVRELQDRQIVSDSNLPIDSDIILVEEMDSLVFIYLILIRNGLYVGDKCFDFVNYESKDSIVEAFLESYYEKEHTHNVYLDYQLSAEFVTYAKRTLQINLRFDFYARIAELKQMGINNLRKILENKRIDNIYLIASQNLAKLLDRPLIKRIECYDTSHNHGISAVASMVVYSHGKVDHKLYRRYNLPDSIGGDDLMALEVVLRRRFANQELELPDVILIDGGRLQLNLAKKLMDELRFHDKISVIAIYKGENRNPELDKIIVNSMLELSFRDSPPIFRLLQHLRDEAHRFAITGHRKKQVDRMGYSKLADIPGIGAKKSKALMAFFGSVQSIAVAKIDELQQVSGIGHDLAVVIHEFFNS